MQYEKMLLWYCNHSRSTTYCLFCSGHICCYLVFNITGLNVRFMFIDNDFSQVLGFIFWDNFWLAVYMWSCSTNCCVLTAFKTKSFCCSVMLIAMKDDTSSADMCFFATQRAMSSAYNITWMYSLRYFYRSLVVFDLQHRWSMYLWGGTIGDHIIWFHFLMDI